MDSEHRQGPGPLLHRFHLSQEDFNTFARLSDDHNPIHVDPTFSAATSFGRTVSHGMLLFSVLRGLLARRYPGSRVQAQSLMFPNPAYADEPLELVVEALDGTTADNVTLSLNVRITRHDGQTCLQGECRLALMPVSTASGETP